ncbi:MAG: hypothetical protein SPI03_03585 [Campylobacter sputorum]|uniref:hypothetical protein n=1 Tax=Campylobacter sputorum TaxID=206 RepID=UPI000B787848|nr:hypothetical protein [Campylobacter sputorum]ASM38504.1 hypothetical protein CSPARA_0934 [Campylobacter sputorum bv. paraureolyticus LMG 11764]MDY6120407.1 hypothetical protein [Campylobacter sputorum]
MNLDKELKNLSFRIGSEISNIAKQKTAPIVTGNLKRDIKARNVSAKGVSIGNTLKASYAKFVHQGTKPYTIKPKNKKVLENKKAGKIFGKKVNHPGIKANPYLQNAFNEYKSGGGMDRALKSFSDELGKKIVSEIKISFNW